MRIAIIGAGKLGTALAEALVNIGHEITLVDKDADLLQKVESRLDIMTVAANAKNPGVLRSLNLASFDCLVAVADEDEKNLVISKFAKDFGCPKTIARVRDPEYVHQSAAIGRNFGVDVVINPDRAMANEIHRYLMQKYDLQGGYFSMGKVSILQFGAERLPALIGMSMRDVSAILGQALVVAISRGGKVLIPNGSTTIEESDGLYVLSEASHIQNTLRPLLEADRSKAGPRHVMIAGGGKSGFYLAEALADDSIVVKIIEIDRKRCEYLSDHLNNVMVLCGDATDTAFLEDENVSGMDAFIALTGFDEENLLLALQSHERRIPDVVAKVSRPTYGRLAESMGVSMALNPTDITVAQVLRSIQGSLRVTYSRLIQGQAEFIEVVADGSLGLLGKPVSSLTLPPDVLLAAIHRGNDVIIPKGDTVIEKGDHIIVFCLLAQVPALEQLFHGKKWS